MTIKQQGGIFGRNPTFNDVDVENDLDVSGNADVSGTSPSKYIDVFSGVLSEEYQARIGYTDQFCWTLGRENATTGDFYIKSVSAGTPTEIARFASTGLKFPNGKGIDFSATSGTGTSELFDDYEEGTWTPEFTASVGSFGSITYTSQLGFYTKIGRTVIVSFTIVVASVTIGTASGALVMSGLPFTASSGGGTTQFQTAFVTQGPDFMQFYGSGTNVLLRSKTATSFTNVAPTEIQASTQLTGTLTYFV